MEAYVHDILTHKLHTYRWHGTSCKGAEAICALGMDACTTDSTAPSTSGLCFSSQSCKCHERALRNQDKEGVKSAKSSGASKAGSTADKHGGGHGHDCAMILCRVTLGLYEFVRGLRHDGSVTKPSVNKDTPGECLYVCIVGENRWTKTLQVNVCLVVVWWSMFWLQSC
jgi:hypothetical protein